MKLIGKEHYIFWVLSQRMMPPIAVAIPFFFIFRDLGLSDTHAGLIIAHWLVNLPLAILLMKSFMYDVPQEGEAAAMFDGAPRFQGSLKIGMAPCRVRVCKKQAQTVVYV